MSPARRKIPEDNICRNVVHEKHTAPVGASTRVASTSVNNPEGFLQSVRDAIRDRSAIDALADDITRKRKPYLEIGRTPSSSVGGRRSLVQVVRTKQQEVVLSERVHTLY